ncbi:hypothetical protein CTEN210_02786 [Chaetoceros tenuissimus]|uniref:Uncharacterized protein n=1 Tax=Chaetoceros tenuissimus TaxID=426638 RepID=A0AAD3CHQ3_9STRA|nr:hypothetical protein CTEN210_02786 [Chaetoceros tenuissimus]
MYLQMAVQHTSLLSSSFIPFHSLSASIDVSKDDETIQTDIEISSTALRSSPDPSRPNKEEEPYFNFSDIVKRNNLARIFGANYPPSSHAWCSAKDQESDGVHAFGLLYNKVPKTASSTITGIIYRLAHRLSKKRHLQKTMFLNQTCHCEADHKPGYIVGRVYGQRDRNASFLVASIRDPTQRAVSRYFHRPNRGTMLSFFANYTKFSINSQFGSVSHGMGGFQLAYMSMTPLEPLSAFDPMYPNQVKDFEKVHRIVHQILQDYDFIIAIDRFEESIVVLQFVLGMEPEDVVYISSKQTGDYIMYGSYPRKVKCKKIDKKIIPQDVDLYLHSKEWDTFDLALKKFLRLKELANRQCASEAMFPCSRDGIAQADRSRTNCYFQDSGCGYPCFDRLFANNSSKLRV